MKAIITGSTGMVGKGVLLECIEDKRVKEILVINRNSLNYNHPKLKEIILKDFHKFPSIKERLSGYDACFHCMGISSVGVSEEEFTSKTYGITKSLATTLYSTNPNMIFNYVTGQGTDSTEQGSRMWARVKGKTENMILDMGFRDAYMFQPGIILPEKNIKSKTKLYNALYITIKPFYGLLAKLKSVTTTTLLGKAMINSYFFPQEQKRLAGAEINKLGKLS